MLKLELQFSGVDDLVTNILNQLFVPLATLLDHTVVLWFAFCFSLTQYTISGITFQRTGDIILLPAIIGAVVEARHGSIAWPAGLVFLVGVMLYA